jgi:hypothetical protein
LTLLEFEYVRRYVSDNKGDSVMAYQGIELTNSYTKGFSGWNTSSIRKTAYNLAAVFALMIAAGVVSSAYHPSDSSASNPRFESMGVNHALNTFRGAAPAK